MTDKKLIISVMSKFHLYFIFQLLASSFPTLLLKIFENNSNKTKNEYKNHDWPFVSRRLIDTIYSTTTTIGIENLHILHLKISLKF